MDDLADRAPQFAAFFIAPNREKVLKMVQMTTYRIPNCDGTINRTGCYDLVKVYFYLEIFIDIFTDYKAT